MNFLQQRAKHLEIRLGDDENPIVDQIALIQAKLQTLYKLNPELHILDRLHRELPPSKRTDTIEGCSDTDEARRQEIIAIHFAQLSETLTSIAELQTIQFPDIPSDMCRALDVPKLLAKREELLLQAKGYHHLLVKTLVVLRQFETAITQENRYWLTYQKRLDAANARLAALERQREARNKY